MIRRPILGTSLAPDVRLRTPAGVGDGVDGVPPGTPPRPVIVESWARCRAFALDPQLQGGGLARLSENELQQRLRANARLIRAARPHLEWLASAFVSVAPVVCLVDGDGIVLQAIHSKVDRRGANALVPGCMLAEAVVGTNGAGTALAARKPTFVEGAEHRASVFHDGTSIGAPILGFDGEVLGAVSLVTEPVEGAAERLLTVAHAAFALGNALQRYAPMELEHSDQAGQPQDAGDRWEEPCDDGCGSVGDERRGPGALYQRLVDVQEYAVFALDAEGRVLTWNRGAERLMGYAVSKIVAQNYSAFHPAWAAARGVPAARLRRAAAEGRAEDQEWWVRSDGTRFWAGVEITALKDPSNGLLGFAAVVRDLTTRRRVEEALRESETRFRVAFDHAAIGMALTNPVDGRWIRVNRSLCALLGYTEAELTDRTFQSLTHPDDLPRNLALVQQALAGTCDECQLEKRLLHKRGHSVWVAMCASVVRDDAGSPRYFIAQFQDITKRKETEEALRASEARYRALHDRAAVGIGLTNPDGRLIQVNPALCELLGYSEAELLSLTNMEITAPEDRPTQRAHLDRLLSGDLRAFTLEKRYARKDGGTVWGRTSVSIIRDDAGAPQHLIAVIEDISDRKQAEEALRESEGRYARIAANVPGVVYQFVYRPDGTKGYTFVSDAARHVLGMEPAEFLRDSDAFLRLVPPGDREALAAEARAAADAHGAFRWEGPVVLPSGEERRLHVIAQDRRLPDGSIGSDGIAIDITERHRAAERLAVSEQRYRSLFDYNPDAVFSLDPAGHFVSANPACAIISGYEPNELIGTSFVPLVAPEDLDRVLATFQAAVNGTANQIEASIRHKSGRPVPLAVTSVPIIDRGQVLGVFGIAKDLTSTRGLEQQLREAQKLEAVGRLAGGVAHDFNNLLTVISSYTQLMIADVGPETSIAADLDQVRQATARATTLTRQLLAFSRKQMLRARRLDVNKTVMEVKGMLQRVIGEDIHVEVELASSLWPVHADAGQLTQVVMNLAVNARDAMSQGGTLLFHTANLSLDAAAAAAYPGAAQGDYVQLLVQDTGIGIDQAVLPHIFEPFYTTKAVGHGTGLGLATVYGIIKQSGGCVQVESTVGEGTRFTILLPRMTGEPASGAIPVEAPLPRGTETILVIDDEPTVRAAARRLLASLGYGVLEAESATDALQMMTLADGHGSPVRLVLTDVVMPGLDGRALAEQVTEHWPEVKVVYMSGYTDDEILRRGLSQPGSEFLEKPFTLERLSAVVRDALGAARR